MLDLGLVVTTSLVYSSVSTHTHHGRQARSDNDEPALRAGSVPVDLPRSDEVGAGACTDPARTAN